MPRRTTAVAVPVAHLAGPGQLKLVNGHLAFKGHGQPLLQRTLARLEAAGYESHLGGLHEYRAGRPSLACDLIEPLRMTAVDRWVIAVCGQNELKPADFVPENSGGFRLRPTAFGLTLYLWETHWEATGQDRELQRWLDALGKFLREHDIPDQSGDEAWTDL